MFKAGEVYLGKYPPGSGKDRRFFILTDEDEGFATVVWVFTSTQLGDETIILQPGVHPAITQTCAVIYSQAQVVSAPNLRLALQGNALRREVDLEPSLLSIIQEGLFASDETPGAVLEYCKDRI